MRWEDELKYRWEVASERTAAEWLRSELSGLPVGETVEVRDDAYHAALYLDGAPTRALTVWSAESRRGSAICYMVDLHDGTVVVLFERYYTARRVRIHE